MDAMWEYQSIHLSAKTVQKSGEQIAVPDLASRLSNAIIESVRNQQAQKWELVKMDFDQGDVTLQFRRLK